MIRLTYSLPVLPLFIIPWFPIHCHTAPYSAPIISSSSSLLSSAQLQAAVSYYPHIDSSTVNSKILAIRGSLYSNSRSRFTGRRQGIILPFILTSQQKDACHSIICLQSILITVTQGKLRHSLLLVNSENNSSRASKEPSTPFHNVQRKLSPSNSNYIFCASSFILTRPETFWTLWSLTKQ